MTSTSSPPGDFPSRIGRSLSAGFALIIAAVLLVGGISVFLAVKIYRNQDAVAHEYRHLVYLEKIDLLYDTVRYDIEQMQNAGRLDRLADVESSEAELKQSLALFRDAHLKENNSAWKPDEEAGFNALWQMAEELEPLTKRLLAAPSSSRQVVLRDLDRLLFISRELRRKVESLSDLHRRRITELLQSSQRMLRGIVVLYLIFIPTGAILIVATSLVFRRRVAVPLRTLADAALGIAEARMGQRVPVDSRDELGQVSHAFNIMAERVETREREITELHMGLQDRVLERTRELEETMSRLIATQEALVRSERMMIVGQTATAVTHGIRTPLSALAINLQLLRRALDRQAFSPEQTRQLLSTADLEVDRINRTLEEFFRYARLPKPRFTTVDCNALVQQTAAFLQGRAVEARVDITLNLEDDPPPIQADADQLREAIQNLASNGIEAMPDGGNLRFETRNAAYNQAKVVMVRISDTGVGIGPQVLPHIFEPFRSTKSRGLGLGLPIALRIAEEHGGTIQCQSVEGAGTTFDILLPLMPPDRSAGPEDSRSAA